MYSSIEHLKDHDEAVAYLNAALEESLKGDAESQHLFLTALRNVAEAQGGIGNLAKKAGIGRESLYKTLSEKGNPEMAYPRLFGYCSWIEPTTCLRNRRFQLKRKYDKKKSDSRESGK